MFSGSFNIPTQGMDMDKSRENPRNIQHIQVPTTTDNDSESSVQLNILGNINNTVFEYSTSNSDGESKKPKRKKLKLNKSVTLLKDGDSTDTTDGDDDCKIIKVVESKKYCVGHTEQNP